MIVTIATAAGPREVHAEHVIGSELLAVHARASGDLFATMFTLSHLPTGYAVMHGDDLDVLRKIGRALVKLVPDILTLTDHEKLKRQMPKPVADWLLRCREHGWTEPPATGGTKMAKLTKEQEAERQRAREKQAKALANKVVEKSRRAIKSPAKDEIAQGWWQGLKADVAAAILTGC